MSSCLVSFWDLPPRVATTVEYQGTPLEAGKLDQQSSLLWLVIDPDSEWPEFFEHPMPDILGCRTSRWLRLHFAKIKLFEWVLSA